MYGLIKNSTLIYIHTFIILQSVKAYVTCEEHNENLKDIEIIQCAIEIANTHFDYRNQVLIISKDVEGSLVSKFIMAYKGTVMVETQQAETPTHQVVVLVKSYFSFINILDKLTPDLKGKALLHSAVRLLIVIFAHPHRLENLNYILWSHYAADVVIVTQNRRNQVLLHTYFPYKNNTSCHNTEPRLIGHWSNKSIAKELFQDKTLDMQGCPLYIATDKLFHPVTDQKVELQSVKQAVVRLLRYVMNFTPIISNKDYLSLDSDRSRNWSTSLHDVITGLANVSTCTCTLDIQGHTLLDYSMPYFRVKFGWIAPPLKPGSMWWRLYSPLNGYLWLVLLIIVIFVKSLPLIVKFKRVKKFCNRYFRNFDKLHSVTFRSWGVLVGQPVRVSPRRFRDFYILGLWIWFTFVVRSAYQSVLIGALKSNITSGKFTSLVEAFNEGYSFGGREDVLIHFDYDLFVKKYYEVIPEPDYLSKFKEVLENRNNFVFAMFLEYAWAYCLSQGLAEDECGFVIPDSVMTVPVVVWMNKNSPFKNSASLWLERFIDSGLLDRETNNKPLMSPVKSAEPTPLTSREMLSCMLCLVVGYMVSIVVFILELSCKTKRFKTNRQVLKRFRMLK